MDSAEMRRTLRTIAFMPVAVAVYGGTALLWFAGLVVLGNVLVVLLWLMTGF